MCECATAVGTGVGFRIWQDDVSRGVRFDGGQVNSDGGLPWIVEAETALGVCAALAAGVPEWRRGGATQPGAAGPPAGVPDRVRV